MKKTLIISLFLWGISAMLFADVIRIKDGRVVVGKISSIDSQGIHLEAFGGNIVVPAAEIVGTEKDFSSLKDMEIEITLKDQSVLRGKIKNYDEDIGFQLEINFGIITVPLENITSIQDPVQRSRYVANFIQIGVAGGYYFMMGDLASSFGNNVNFQVFGEFNLGFLLEGLFAGIDLSYYNVDCTQSGSYSYLLFGLTANVSYRFLQLRPLQGFVRNMVPFVGAGVGTGIPIMTNSGVTEMEADLSFSGFAGIDYFITDSFLIRVSGCWQPILQSTKWFQTITISMGAGYSF
ncbi:MAG: hypothetical protein EHM28_15610 [Spirochaetaceae bacterium]|nr:MAG: hypothetical protein EHM28_15610 [Spirochaetaceae bacterium]